MENERMARAAAATLVDWIAPLLTQQPPPGLTGRRKGAWSRAAKVWRLLEPQPGDRPGLEEVARQVLERWDEPAQRRSRDERRHDAIGELAASLDESLGEDEALRADLTELVANPTTLTFFLLRDAVEKFEEALKVTALEKNITIYELGHERALEVFGWDRGIEARLFVVDTVPLYPEWLAFLQDGFGDVTLAESAANQAVLVVKVTHQQGERFFALPFGAGWMLLEPRSYDHDFGLVAALNAIYGPGATDPAAIPGRDLGPRYLRGMDYTKIERLVHRFREQASGLASSDEFGVDPRRDLLTGVAGRPSRTDRWGDLIVGSSPLHLKVPVRFAELATWCRKLLDLWGQTSYQERFGWIDKVKPVEDPALVAALEAWVVEQLKAHPDGGSKLELAPPEVLNLGKIAGFTFSLGDDGSETDRMADVFLDDYFRAVAAGLADLDLDRLQNRHMVHAYDAKGDEVGQWPVFQWLDGDMEYQGEVYTLLEGEFRKIDPAYMKDLDGFLGTLKEWDAHPITVRGKWKGEGEFNETAGKQHADQLLCLDRKTVRVPSQTEPIELCDLLSTNGDFIHVKCKFRSSSLSHLFSQGAVSAKLFLDPEFRKAALAKIEEIAGPAEAGRFTKHFQPTGHDPVDHDAVVYAIIGPWAAKTGNGQAPAGQKLARALPFFSKVNLRSRAEELMRLGYRVYYEPIEEAPVAPAPAPTPSVAAGS